MVAKLTATQLTAMEALTSLEEVIYVCQRLDEAQTAWNAANPQFQRTAIDLNAGYP